MASTDVKIFLAYSLYLYLYLFFLGKGEHFESDKNNKLTTNLPNAFHNFMLSYMIFMGLSKVNIILRSEKGYAILRKNRMSIIYLYAYLSVRVSMLAETDQRFDKLHRLTSAHWMRSTWIGDEKEESEMGIEDEEESAADE
ncbi:hypothetical protein T06_5631 [Trichinella sp. T6]|nr:hypothetical protein T06_5631 [Trichinella sp. T6]